jgi:hypothetical protein
MSIMCLSNERVNRKKKSSRLVKLCVPTVPMEDRLRRMNTETID